MGSDGSSLGNLIRLVRQRHRMTLKQMSEKVGIPLSTLAKVETHRLSLTYEKLQQVTSRLGLSMAEFLAEGEAAAEVRAPQITGRRSVTAEDNSVQIVTPSYDYEYLCADLRDKRMVPVFVRVHAKSIAEFGDMARHQGEEFIFVLEGSIEVHMQYYTPVLLTAGQGIYLDSAMGHAYVAKDCDSALLLAVCSSEHPERLAGELITRAETEAKQVA